MRHLEVEELVDIAEGAAAGKWEAHLASCGACRQRLADLRSVMESVKDVDVPEPSPLFWDHLSARVREAVAREDLQKQSGLTAWTWPSRRLVATLSGAAAAALVAAIWLSRPEPTTQLASAGDPVETAATVTANVPDDPSVDDPTFGLISELTADIDIDTALAAGLASEGSADQAVVHLTGDELLELQRLLQETLGQTQAS
jgi:hypothetical protein